ncbi:MAG: hypothetical protein HGA87_00355 [Desulfobulbaceae bacterium]|nr:hypothetical protein [Desulfobulbaceae bacterium]
MDNDIVNEKIKNKDFDVQVSPEFDIDGKKYRVITDGHHSLAAALKSRNTPNFKEQTEQDNDRIALLNNGDIEGFLESTHQGDDYRNRINNNLVF